MSDEELKALWSILAQYGRDEFKDYDCYEDEPPENHIWNSLEILQKFYDKQMKGKSK